MLCRVEMTANEQIYARFFRYKLMHNIGDQKRGGLILTLVLAAALLLMMWNLGISPLALAVVAVLVAGYFVYTLSIRPGQLFRAQPGAAMKTEVTIFTDSGINRSIRSEEDGSNEAQSLQYAALYAAVETRRDFYLFTGPAQAILIDKEHFTKGEPAELRACLARQMGGKFKPTK